MPTQGHMGHMGHGIWGITHTLLCCRHWRSNVGNTTNSSTVLHLNFHTQTQFHAAWHVSPPHCCPVVQEPTLKCLATPMHHQQGSSLPTWPHRAVPAQRFFWLHESTDSMLLYDRVYLTTHVSHPHCCLVVQALALKCLATPMHPQQ